MMTTCERCSLTYDDVYRWTTCPHDEFRMMTVAQRGDGEVRLCTSIEELSAFNAGDLEGTPELVYSYQLQLGALGSLTKALAAGADEELVAATFGAFITAVGGALVRRTFEADKLASVLVLEPADDPDAALVAVRKLDALGGARSCEGCGCTDLWACEGGCSWAGPRMCSSCASVTAR